MTVTSEFHLTQPRLGGPAERTLVEIRLSALSGQPLNTYIDDRHESDHVGSAPRLSLVDPVADVHTSPARPAAEAARAA